MIPIFICTPFWRFNGIDQHFFAEFNYEALACMILTVTLFVALSSLSETLMPLFDNAKVSVSESSMIFFII